MQTRQYHPYVVFKLVEPKLVEVSVTTMEIFRQDWRYDFFHRLGSSLKKDPTLASFCKNNLFKTTCILKESFKAPQLAALQCVDHHVEHTTSTTPELGCKVRWWNGMHHYFPFPSSQRFRMMPISSPSYTPPKRNWSSFILSLFHNSQNSGAPLLPGAFRGFPFSSLKIFVVCMTLHTGLRDPTGHFCLGNSQLSSKLHQVFST